jgi:hypothetical protein
MAIVAITEQLEEEEVLDVLESELALVFSVDGEFDS